MCTFISWHDLDFTLLICLMVIYSLFDLVLYYFVYLQMVPIYFINILEKYIS